MLLTSDNKRILLFQIYPVWRGPSLDMRVPLGMLYLGNSLIKAGYEVEVFHIEEGQIDSEISKIDFDDILFIGVCSVLTGFSLRSAISFSKKVRSKYNIIPVVWGGVQASSIPEICLKEEFVDAVGIGEGEELIVDIAKVFNGLRNPNKVKGLAFKDVDGSIIVNERRDFIKDFDEYHADYSLIDLTRYIINGNITGLIMSSRGCPFNCTFCYNNAFNKGRWRKHSAEYVINELRRLHSQYKFTAFSFSDDNFFVDKDRAITLIKESYNLGLRVYSVDIKIDHITDSDIKAFGQYEVGSIFFGTESLNPRLIKLINKKQTKERVIEVIKMFAQYAPDIPLQTEILMALPFERKSELRQDIIDGLELYNYNKNLSVYFGVLFPLSNTEMMGYAKANGFSPETVYEYARIDLNNVWSICDQWTLFDLTEREKRKIYLTEKYSALLSCDRRPHSYPLFATLERIRINLIFNLARFRLKHWFFLFYKFDFWVARLSFPITKLITPLAIIYRRIIKKVDKSVNFRNFGYIPGRFIIQNIKNKLFGIPNLMKRLQATDIIKALDIQPSDVVLDFGCGSGYFTVEMAKLAKKAYGIDINEYIKQIEIPKELMGRLEYVQTSGTQLPFQDSFFDVVLASEILPMIPDPSEFLAEIRRVLKHTGRLVIVNGAGHPVIKDAFEKRPWFFRWLQIKYPERMPESYGEYCSILQKSFGTAQKNFIEEKDIRNLLTQANILLEDFTYSPGYLAGAYFSWSQFLLYLRTGKTLSQQSFVLKYCILRMFAAIDRRKYPGGLLCIARNIKNQGNEHSLLNS